MRVIVIDAKKLEVREEQMDDKKHLDFFYKTIGCNCVDRVVMEPCYKGNLGTDIWVDDNGLLTNPKRFIMIGNARLAGSAIVTGFDYSGNTLAAPDHVTVEFIKNRVAFLVIP